MQILLWTLVAVFCLLLLLVSVALVLLGNLVLILAAVPLGLVGVYGTHRSWLERPWRFTR